MKSRDLFDKLLISYLKYVLRNGPVAQRLEHLHGMQGVAGSNPVGSTTLSVVKAALSAAPKIESLLTLKLSIMQIVYVLISKRDSRLYIGICRNIKKSLDQHNRGNVFATKNRTPFILLYCEYYSEINDAKRREKYLKGGKGHNELKIQIQDALLKNDYKFI